MTNNNNETTTEGCTTPFVLRKETLDLALQYLNGNADFARSMMHANLDFMNRVIDMQQQQAPHNISFMRDQFDKYIKDAEKWGELSCYNVETVLDTAKQFRDFISSKG